MCKISGVVTEAHHDSWTIDDIKPYVMHALEVFGEDRVVFGSDWPVCTLATSYKRWVETLENLTGEMSDEAKTKFWRGNATRFYRLDA
jgi:L-fuconolactonase